MSDTTTVFVTGKVYWAKIIGAPRDNYERTGREWTYEFEPDDIGFLKKAGLLDRLKSKNATDGRGEYLTLKKPELDKEGNKNEPLRIYDHDGNPWDDRLLGNGTEVVVKLNIVDWGRGKKKSIYTKAIRVEKLVPYTPDEFAGFDDNTESKTKVKTEKTAKSGVSENAMKELDDDFPF